ncbi:MAG: glycosyltransferase family 2 protein [Faecousia sp.]
MAQISVIVPVYRVEAYLDRCVNSILRQTFGDFELILVDDGSPDNCGQMCDAYAALDPRVHVIHQENAGLSAARNAALDWVFASSLSRWVTFIDSDDWVHPEMLQRLLEAAESQGVSIAVCGYGETEGEDPTVEPDALTPERWTAKVFYLERFVNATIACAKLYDRSCFASVRYPVGKLHEDEFVTYRLLFAGEALAYIPAPLYAYYKNPEGITKNAWSPGRLDAWEAYEQQITFFQELGDEELVSFRLREYLENAMRNLQSAQESPNADQLTKEIRKIRATIKRLIPRAWKGGCIEFWPDYELLQEYYPIRARICRFLLEHRKLKIDS